MNWLRQKLTSLKRGFRLGWFATTAAFLLALIFFISPQQLPVILLKIALVIIGGLIGYWLDRNIFPEGRPVRLTEATRIDARLLQALAAAYIRRAILIGCAMLALAIAV